MKRALALVALILLTAAGEPVLVPAVSQRQVEIVYSFTGTDLLLFGAIVYPGGRVPDGRADIAVVLKGPSQSIIVREKQKLNGLIWANADAMRFRTAPVFYAVASSRPLSALVSNRTAARYELGLDNLKLSSPTAAGGETQRFESGLIDLRHRAGLFVERPGAVTIARDVLYSARLSVPARVPIGHYTAETFLIRDGRVVAAASTDIEIRKSGFERFVANAAQNYPFAYGLVAVALSIGLGWVAGSVFRRA